MMTVVSVFVRTSTFDTVEKTVKIEVVTEVWITILVFVTVVDRVTVGFTVVVEVKVTLGRLS
jgi:hypothetical protein